MHSRKINCLKASDLIKNFSRGNHQNIATENHPPLRMKQRKMAFTTRMIHPTGKKPVKQQNPLNFQLKRSQLLPKNPPTKTHHPQMFLPLPMAARKSAASSRPQPHTNQSPFFDMRHSFRNRALSPKILRIAVNSSRFKNRAYSANTGDKCNERNVERGLGYGSGYGDGGGNPEKLEKLERLEKLENIGRLGNIGKCGFNSFQFTFGIHERI